MSVALTNADQGASFLHAKLSKAPSDGLKDMLTELFAIGLPVTFTQAAPGSTDFALISREGISIGLPAAPLDEGAIAHEVAHALLETQGWPRLFNMESQDHWLGKTQSMLIHLLDHAAGLALQRTYGIDTEANEAKLLAPPYNKVLTLLKQADALARMDLTADQQVEFAIGIALTVLDQHWRKQEVADGLDAVLDIIPGTRSLFESLHAFHQGGTPTTGWHARRLLQMYLARIDDFLEVKGDARPMMLLTNAVPGIHAADRDKPVQKAAQIFLQPLQGGEHNVLVVCERDGLPFNFRVTYANREAAQSGANAMAAEPFAPFCRKHVPQPWLIWQPTGEAG